MFLFWGALGTRLELSKLDAAYFGAPLCIVPAKNSIELALMDFVYYGAPVVPYARG